MSSRVLWRREVSCAEYKPTEDQSVLSKTGDTVEVQCVEEDSGVPTGQNWTVMCVDGEWVSDDGRQVDCTSPNITRNINDTILEEGKIQAQQLVSSGNERSFLWCFRYLQLIDVSTLSK